MEIINTLSKIFLNWKKDALNRKLIIYGNEITVCSKNYGYAGTIDAVGAIETSDKKLNIYILDWKTSNSLQKEYAMQLAAYAKAFEEYFNLSVHSAVIVRIDKEKSIYEERTIKNIEDSFDDFKAALRLFRHQEGNPFVD